MRILLDHCVPKPFARELPAHAVRTAAQMGWSDLQNGRLLAEAAQHFDVFITVDKNIKTQRNLRNLPLPIIGLDTVKNTPEALAPFAPHVERVLPMLRPGQMVEIDAAGKVTEIASGR